MDFKIDSIVNGQECVCPDGLGRVQSYDVTENYIQVETYFQNRGCKWAPHNVKMVAIQCQPSKQVG